MQNLIGQLVNVMKDGKPVRMSKRAGNVVTIDDLVSVVGVDAARYSLARSDYNQNFDIDLADCLAMVQQVLGDVPLPPIRSADLNPDLSSLEVNPGNVGVPVWRGIWSPWLYPHRPVAQGERAQH